MGNNDWFDFSAPPSGYNGGGAYGSMGPGEYNSRLREARAKEKKALFKNASYLGILLILYNIFNSVFLRVFYVVSYSVLHGGFTLDITTIARYLYADSSAVGYSSAYSMTLNLCVVVMSVAALLVIAVCVMKIRLQTMLKPYKGFIKQGASVTPMCLTLNIFVSYIVAIFVAVMSEQGVTVPDADFTVTSTSTYAVVIQLLYVCVVGPVVEEIIYRGLVIKLLSPYGKGMAVVFSALIFGLMHGNIPQAASAFAAGLIYAATAVYFDSIAPTIVIHILNNCFASITDIGDAVGFAHSYELYYALNIVFMFLGIYALFVKLRKLINGIRSTEPQCALQSNQRYITVFTNVFMLIYFISVLWDFVKSFVAYNS